jgi:hypothetical protein
MPTLSNGCVMYEHLAFQLDVLRKEPANGMIDRSKRVAMNSNLGLLWCEVGLWWNEEPYFQQEVLIFFDDIQAFTEAALDIIEHKGANRRQRVVRFRDSTSPELLLEIHQVTIDKRPCGLGDIDLSPQVDDPQRPNNFSCNSLIGGADPAVAYDGYASGQGPTIYLGPTELELYQFVRDLRSEAEICMLLKEE